MDEGALVEHEAGRDRARLLQRRLLIWIALATLLTWAIVIADLERGGRPDPSTLRAAAILLDGHWRFRTGDDLRWADASADDSDWEAVDLTAAPGSHDGDVGLPDYVGGWMAHGHPRHTGYAWYRRVVTVPAGRASWDGLGPTLVEDGYEIYWAARESSARIRVSSARGRCDSPFPQTRQARAACLRFAHSCFPGPRPVQTAAACTACPSWRPDR